MRTDPLGPDETAAAERLFDLLLTQYENARARPPGFGYSSQDETDKYYRYRHARLFASGYPEVAERRASQVALDPSAPGAHRDYVLWMLEVLACAGRPMAEATLLKLCREHQSTMAVLAFMHLSVADLRGKHLKLYHEMAETEFRHEVLYYLPAWQDERSLQIARETKRQTPEGWTPGLAIEAIDKMELLRSANWQSRLREIIEGDYREHGYRLPWALRAAQTKGLPGLIRILRHRLDLLETEKTPDGSFYSVLLAYAEVGGHLNEREKNTLRSWGYACEPRQRLAELLADEE